MLRLRRWEDLDVLKVVESPRCLGFIRRRVVAEVRDYVQCFQHVPGEVWSIGA